MKKELNAEDLKFILESLNYTKLNFEGYDKYPSSEFKQNRIKQVDNVISKVKYLLKNLE